MLEIYVLVPVKRKMILVFAGILSMVLALAALVLSCMIQIFILLALAFGAAGYWLLFQTNMEYEYSYFDGEARFAKVINKSRRRKLAVYTMDEVVQVAPEEDRSVYKYLHDQSVKQKDYSSHQKEARCYVMVVNQGGQMQAIRYEPDEKYLDGMAVKYAQKIIRRKEA